MPKSTVTVSHTLGQEQALARLQGFAAGLRERYKDMIKDLEEKVEGNKGTFSFKTMGLKINGTLLVEAENVTVALDLPLAAAMFKGRIEGEIREQLTRKLAS